MKKSPIRDQRGQEKPRQCRVTEVASMFEKRGAVAASDSADRAGEAPLEELSKTCLSSGENEIVSRLRN